MGSGQSCECHNASCSGHWAVLIFILAVGNQSLKNACENLQNLAICETIQQFIEYKPAGYDNKYVCIGHMSEFETDTFENGGSPRDLNPGPPAPQTRDHPQYATPVTLPGQCIRTHIGLPVMTQSDLEQFSSCYTVSFSESLLAQGQGINGYCHDMAY